MCKVPVGTQVVSTDSRRIRGRVEKTSCGGRWPVIVVRTRRGRIDECRGPDFGHRWEEVETCANCGADLDSHGDMWHCPKCGNEWAMDDRP